MLHYETRDHQTKCTRRTFALYYRKKPNIIRKGSAPDYLREFKHLPQNLLENSETCNLVDRLNEKIEEYLTANIF